MNILIKVILWICLLLWGIFPEVKLLQCVVFYFSLIKKFGLVIQSDYTVLHPHSIYEGSYFSIFVNIYLIIASLVDKKWCFVMVLIYISLMNNILTIFSCASLPFRQLFEAISVHNLCITLKIELHLSQQPRCKYAL